MRSLGDYLGMMVAILLCGLTLAFGIATAHAIYVTVVRVRAWRVRRRARRRAGYLSDNGYRRGAP